MPSTLFEPFHVYEIDRRTPVGARFPYKHFMCFTQPEFNEPQEKFNVIGFPILPRTVGRLDDRIRMLVRTHATSPPGELLLPYDPVLAVDLIQPLPRTLLRSTSTGMLSEPEIKLVREMVRRFLAL